MSSSEHPLTEMSHLVERYRSSMVSRRRLLWGAGLSAGAAGLSLALAACGGSSTTPTTSTSGGASTSTTTSSSSSSGGSTPAAASTTAPSAGAIKKGGTLTAAQTNENATLDPLTSGFVSERQAYYNMYDSLVAIDTHLTIIPDLADSWEVSTDGKTYTFKLHQGVKFHDGTDFNADAVKFNLMRYVTDPKSARVGEVNFITSVDSVDANTAKVNMKAAFAPFLANLVDRAGMMLSPTAVQKGGADFSRKPVGAGTGAFMFVEWINNDHLTLKKNPNYWKKDSSGNPLPYLDQLIFKPITDTTVLLTNVETGTIDATYAIAPKDVAGAKTNSSIVLRTAPGLSFDAFEFNTSQPPFNKKELRQAVAEALDRSQISKTIYYGIEQVGYGPIPPSSWAFDPTLQPWTGSVDKAKQYLSSGGQPNGFTFDYKLGAGNPVTLQLLQLVKDQVAKAGITLNITQEDAPTIQSEAQKGNYQATGYGWSGRIDPDGNIYNFFHTGGGLNQTKYSNPQVDKLLDQTREASDQAQRKTLFQQAQKLIVEDAPMAWWGFAPAYLLTRPTVQGMQIYADYIMRFHTAWLK
ncbi:MAG TPA: ABC transporter substrate-binding protein [Thermomicrobiaceae bacterium]|nr:ABC transporter substrate-binding protein [Thermomicrobiaceae bacterium]